MRKDEERTNKPTDGEKAPVTEEELQEPVKAAIAHIERHRETFEELAKR